MNSLKKLERDRTVAELATVEMLIASMDDEDVMTRMGLEGQRDELREQISDLMDFDEPNAAAALFFGGRPVVGQHGIESEFAGSAISKFQDLVSKLLVQEIGALGQRGPVPNKGASTMHITNIVRGSFGFLMEEMQSQGQLVDTALTKAIDDASKLMAAFGDSNEENFQSAVEKVDQRILATAGEFFALLENSGATLRLVAGEHDDSFGSGAVALAAQRAVSTTIEETEEHIYGQLIGVLPDGHMFEFRSPSGAIIKGRVNPMIPSTQLMEWNRALLNVDARARIKVRRVSKDGEIVRQSFTMLELVGNGGSHLMIGNI